MTDPNQKYALELTQIMMTGALCVAIKGRLIDLQEKFGKESEYFNHFEQSLRDLQRMESLLENASEHLMALGNVDTTGARN